MSIKPSDAPLPDLVPVRRALISVYDKTGIADLAGALAERGVEIVSTGGTRTALTAAGIATRDITEVTGFPEIMDGRVKTLHPAIHGGLLGVRDDAGHARAMADHGIAGIDLLVVNLYPFEATMTSGAGDRAIVENIDIGGPALIRAAAKNHAYVAVVVDPADYPEILSALDTGGGGMALDLRRRLAGKAFARTAAYDAAIAGWFAERAGDPLGNGGPSAATGSSVSVTARTLTSLRRSTGTARPVPALPAPGRCRASSFRTTTSTTPMPPSSWRPSSIRRSRQR